MTESLKRKIKKFFYLLTPTVYKIIIKFRKTNYFVKVQGGQKLKKIRNKLRNLYKMKQMKISQKVTERS